MYLLSIYRGFLHIFTEEWGSNKCVLPFENKLSIHRRHLYRRNHLNYTQVHPSIHRRGMQEEPPKLYTSCLSVVGIRRRNAPNYTLVVHPSGRRRHTQANPVNHASLSMLLFVVKIPTVANIQIET